MLIVVAEVVQVEVERFRDAVGGTGVGVLLSDDVHFTEHGHLDVAHQHIGAKERRAARRTRGT